MAKKKLKNKLKMRMAFFGVGSFVILIVIFTFIGSYWVQIINKYSEKTKLANDLTELQEKEEALKVDVEKLEDPEYIARYAREKYMYSKDGEYIIVMPDE